jgi:Protein of unknown function (DUF2934)
MENEQLNQLIRRRAYRIWEREGRPEGRALGHWVQAESEYRKNLVTFDTDSCDRVHRDGDPYFLERSKPKG